MLKLLLNLACSGLSFTIVTLFSTPSYPYTCTFRVCQEKQKSVFLHLAAPNSHYEFQQRVLVVTDNVPWGLSSVRSSRINLMVSQFKLETKAGACCDDPVP